MQDCLVVPGKQDKKAITPVMFTSLKLNSWEGGLEEVALAWDTAQVEEQTEPAKPILSGLRLHKHGSEWVPIQD